VRRATPWLAVLLAAALVVWLWPKPGDPAPDPRAEVVSPTREAVLHGRAPDVAPVPEASASEESLVDELLVTIRAGDEGETLAMMRRLVRVGRLPERPDLLEALLTFGSENPLRGDRRTLALIAIAWFGPWCVEPLAHVAATGPVTARTQLALQALASHGSAGVRRVADLLRTWTPSDPADRSRLLTATGHLGLVTQGDSAAVAALRDLLRAPDRAVVEVALESIGRHGPQAASASGAVRAVWEESEPGSMLRVGAARAWWRLMGDEGLVLGLVGEGPGYPFRGWEEVPRDRAYQALAEVGEPAVRLLEDLVRRRAPGALGALAAVDPLPADSFKTFLDSEIVNEQVLGLSGLIKAGVRGRPLEPEILALLDSRSEIVRRRALTALQAVSGADATRAPRAALALQDREVQVRIEAARMFAESPVWTRAEREAVNAALSDPCLNVRGYAELALARAGRYAGAR